MLFIVFSIVSTAPKVGTVDADSAAVPPLLGLAMTIKDGRLDIGPMPSEFISRLLKDAPGKKRLMPGHVLALGPSPVGTPEFARHLVITTDISTTAGTGGSPLIELKSGRVIGVSYAGRSQGERGKFAYADPIPRAALDVIARRTRGEAEPDGAALPANRAAAPVTSASSGEK